MKESANFTNEKDVLGQDIPRAFIKMEEEIQKPENPDYSKIYVLPSIRIRYTSMLIDVLILVLFALGISSLFEKIGNVPGFVRGIIFIIVVLLYEPFLTCYGATIGQLIMNIRVRNYLKPHNKLTIQAAILRTSVKIILGWLSFVTVTFNVNRRAIHDMISGSIMISNKLK